VSSCWFHLGPLCASQTSLVEIVPRPYGPAPCVMPRVHVQLTNSFSLLVPRHDDASLQTTKQSLRVVQALTEDSMQRPLFGPHQGADIVRRHRLVDQTDWIRTRIIQHKAPGPVFVVAHVYQDKPSLPPPHAALDRSASCRCSWKFPPVKRLLSVAMVSPFVPQAVYPKSNPFFNSSYDQTQPSPLRDPLWRGLCG